MQSKKNIVLITGGSGFIGQSLIRCKRFKFCKNSLRSWDWKNKISKHKPFAIVHLAGPSCDTRKKERVKNLIDTRDLLQEAIRNKVQRFIFLSSILTKPKNCPETAPQNYKIKGILSIFDTNYSLTGLIIFIFSVSNLGPNFIRSLHP